MKKSLAIIMFILGATLFVGCFGPFNENEFKQERTKLSVSKTIKLKETKKYRVD